MPRRRDIALARFPFADQTAAKLRPILILADPPGPYPDHIALFISLQLSQAIAGLDLVLMPGHPAFTRSGLKTASVFRIGRVATISDSMIIGTLGQLDRTVFDQIAQRLIGLLRGR